MVDLKIVKEQYQRMPDEELVRFAINESQKLTIESFHLLKAEFEERNLDLGVIEAVETENELAEATRQSEFERATVNAFAETIWQFAFDEKEKGKSNREIYNSLLKKNVGSDYACMLIESIEPRAQELVDSFDTDIIVGWILAIAGAGLLIFTLNAAEPNINFLVWGSILALGGAVRLFTSYRKKRKFEIIVSNVEAEKEAENNLYQ